MDEQLTVYIGGRKALPVRAIPHVTGWAVGELVQHFSRKVGAPFERLQDVYAYHLSSGQPVKYLPREWDGIQINLNALDAELHEKFKNDDQGYAAWHKEAVSILPEGVFVWLDEFEKDCCVNLSPSRIIFLNERDGDRKLNYTPHSNSETREIVFAGFDELCAKPAKAEALPITQANTTQTLPALFDPVPVEALEKMFPCDGKWKGWAERAARNKLKDAREGRAKFNPYKAAIWLTNKGVIGFDLARCYRTLANNLPARSKDKADLLTGNTG